MMLIVYLLHVDDTLLRRGFLFFLIGLLSGSAGARGDGVGMCGSKGGMVFITPLPPQRALLARTAR